MTKENILDSIRENFRNGHITDVRERTPKRIYITVTPDIICGLTKLVTHDLHGRFNTLSAIDMRTYFEILYHFTFDEINLVVTFRTKLSDRQNPRIESISNIIEGANWIERETAELFGIEFTGHPDMRRLLLPDEWPQGVYPLRKDYKEWDKGAIRDRGI